jgi:2-dehydro-3-deoxy-D-pentonate aldolase
MSADSAPQFHGIVPPVITPLLDAERLDEAGLERLLEHLITGGVHGLFMLGSNGEGPSLDEAVQHHLIERTCRQVNGRVPILMGISHTSLAESVAAAKFAADAGCAAVVSTAPYYMPLNQSELLYYIRELARRVPLPLVLYNFPLLSKISFEPETVTQLLDESNIVGMKDSSGDLDYFAKIVAVAKLRPGYSLLAGKEANLADVIELGGHGGVPGGANVWPQLLVGLYEAAITQDRQRIAEWKAKVVELGKIYSVVGDHFSAGIAGLKAAVELRGICSGVLAPPIQPVTSQQKAEIKAILASLELL